MDINANNFNLPPGFVMPENHKSVSEEEGIARFDYGKSGYVAWRFAREARPWKPDKVKKYRVDGSDTVPVLLFYRDKDNVVPIKLKRRMRYEEKLNRYGEPYDKAYPLQLTENDKAEGLTELDLWELPIGFDSEMFQVAYEKFKEQGSKPGMPISAWRADPGQVNTLAALGIFTVDAFGEMSEQDFGRKVEKLPPSGQGPLKELHEMAIAYCNTASGRYDAEKFVGKLEALEDSNEKLQMALEAKDEEMQALLEKVQGAKKTTRKRSTANKG